MEEVYSTVAVLFYVIDLSLKLKSIGKSIWVSICIHFRIVKEKFVILCFTLTVPTTATMDATSKKEAAMIRPMATQWVSEASQNRYIMIYIPIV